MNDTLTTVLDSLDTLSPTQLDNLYEGLGILDAISGLTEMEYLILDECWRLKTEN